MIYLLLILLIFILAWREVLHLCERGSWNFEDYRIPVWYIHWRSKWKVFDTFHLTNGLITLIFIYLLLMNPNIYKLYVIYDIVSLVVNIIAYWIIWMWLRNIFMHVVFKKKPEWKYLLPFGGLLWK